MLPTQLGLQAPRTAKLQPARAPRHQLLHPRSKLVAQRPAPNQLSHGRMKRTCKDIALRAQLLIRLQADTNHPNTSLRQPAIRIRALRHRLLQSQRHEFPTRETARQRRIPNYQKRINARHVRSQSDHLTYGVAHAGKALPRHSHHQLNARRKTKATQKVMRPSHTFRAMPTLRHRQDRVIQGLHPQLHQAHMVTLQKAQTLLIDIIWTRRKAHALYSSLRQKRVRQPQKTLLQGKLQPRERATVKGCLYRHVRR